MKYFYIKLKIEMKCTYSLIIEPTKRDEIENQNMLLKILPQRKFQICVASPMISFKHLRYS